MISAIDFDNSPAAVAATSTLPKASLEVRTAPAVCAVVSFDVADRAIAVDFIATTLAATGLQNAFDALAEPGNRLIDGGTARLLLAKEGALPLRSPALGDVVVGPTQYLLPGIARLTIDMARPFGVSATMLSALPAAMASTTSAQ